MIEQIIKDLQENGKVIVRGFGTFYLVPARKGKPNCGFKWAKNSENRFSKRLKVVFSNSLKKKVCK